MHTGSKFVLPTMFFPEWWDVHTHRCNHVSAIPTHQVNYGVGRALFADWGRVGATCIHPDANGVQVIPQISIGLVDKLHYSGAPVSLLPPFYLNRSETLDGECYVDADSNNPDAALDSLTTFDFGFGQWLSDPLLSDQSASAFLCGKVMGLIRRNASFLSEKKTKAVDILDLLDQLEQLASDGLNATSCSSQFSVIQRISEQLHGSDTQTTNHTPSNNASKSIVPGTLKNVMDLLGSDESRLLSATDPSLIRLASLPSNPNYCGRGLLRIADNNLIFCPPHSYGKPRNLYVFDIENNSLNSLPLPANLAFKERMYELDLSKCCNTAVTRWSSELGVSNVSFIRIDMLKENNSSPDCIFSPLLPGSASSIAVNPWLSTEWGVLGYSSLADYTKVGFVHVYSEDRFTPVWSGHIKLDEQIDGLDGYHGNVLSAAGFTNATDHVQSNLNSYSKLVQTPSPLQSTPAHAGLQDFGLRMAYGSHPSEIVLSTRRRILLLDTRQPQCCRDFFSLAAHSDETTSTFNPTEYFTHAPLRLIGDVYGIAATPFSMLYLDKRMPGHCVSHWTHNLHGCPVYLDWTLLDETIREKHDLPHMILSAACQFPADISLFGTNLFHSAGPQFVGPSFSGTRPISVLNSGNDLPSQLLHCPEISLRLRSTFCGLATMADDSKVSSFALTSRGDLFRYSWAFTKNGAREIESLSHLKNTEWLTEFMCQPDQTANTDEQECQQSFDRLDLTEISRLRSSEDQSMDRDECLRHWNFGKQLSTTKKVLAAANSSCQHYLADLNAIWNGSDQEIPTHLSAERLSEERERRIELDSLTSAVKSRLERLKSVIDRLMITPD